MFVDPTNPNHAIVTFSGYEANTPTTLGHVFDVVYDPASHTATWTNISFDIGDQPVNDAVLDTATGDLYVSTDFGVYRRVSGDDDVDPGRGRPADGCSRRASRSPPARTATGCSTRRRTVVARTGSA